MDTPLSASEAARRFADVVNRVRYRGESFVVERAGEPVCRIVPPAVSRRTLADLVRILDEVARPDSAYWKEVEKAKRRQPKLRRSPWGR